MLRVRCNSPDETAVAATHSGAAAAGAGLGFVALVARVVGGHQARRVTDCTVSIGDSSATAADKAVIVTGAAFAQTWPACRRDATHQPNVRACEYSTEPISSES